MNSIYIKTQTGFVIIAAVAAAIALEVFLAISRQQQPLTVATICLILVVVGTVFSTMTVSVDATSVKWWFSLHLLPQRIFISNITAVAVSNANPLNGYGIRSNGRDVRWIVSGTRVVVLSKCDGKKIYLGSSDADKLAAAIESTMAESQRG